MQLHHSKLSIQNRLESLPEAEACAGRVADIIGFSRQDNKKIQLALEEALSNIIKHSFSSEQTEFIDIEFCQEVLGLRVSILVKGIPFDPSLFPVYDKEKLEKEYDDRGLGNFLIREVMDEFTYINHGQRGIEIMLKKHLPVSSISDILDSHEAADPPAAVAEPDKPHYSVGLMQANEAVEVSRLAYFSYGYTYPYENIYFPEKVAKLNESGHLLSMVARLHSGTIIGHSALELDCLPSVNAELGIAFSNPAYRGLGILNKLWGALVDKAAEQNVLGIFAMAVTTHPYSQKAAHRFGMEDCALLLSKVPVLKFKDIEEGSHPRESIMIAYRYMQLPGHLTIYPPQRHAVMVGELAAKLGLPVHIKTGESDMKVLRGRENIATVKTDKEFITASIYVQQYGENCLEKLHDSLRKLCIERYETIYLHIPLCDPFSGLVGEEAENAGFLFSGIMPENDQNVFLIYQFLNNQQIDYDSMDIDSETGKKLLSYIRSHDGNKYN